MTFVEQKIISQLKSLSEEAKQRLLEHLTWLLQSEKAFDTAQWHTKLLNFPTWPDYNPPKVTSWEIEEW